MRTVKEVADLTGVSTRTLQYYDEIGVLKPTTVNKTGYRLYDDIALQRLQQILFFKELDFQLKEIKEIMENPNYNKIEVFKKQRLLLTQKRDRLNRLLSLLEKLEKGEIDMSFKEFDMSGYIEELEIFKSNNTEAIEKHWGSLDKFDDFIKKVKENEDQIAKIAIQQFGSIEKYTEAMKYNMEHFDEIMEKAVVLQENPTEALSRIDELYKKLTSDLMKNVSESEIQNIVHEIVTTTNENNLVDMGNGFWEMVIESYSSAEIRKINNDKYGEGASDYIVEALKYYFNHIRK